MSIYNFSVQDAQGNDVSLKQYEGKVLLIVNTATGCGFTPQYEGLEKIHESFASDAFALLDFPCNQFLEQAPGSNEEIVSFCKLNYNTQFDTFAKVDVNGENAHPLYQFLKEQAPTDTVNGGTEEFLKLLDGLGQTREGSEIKWNFTKFLIGKDGQVIERFSPTITPEELSDKIKAAL